MEAEHPGPALKKKIRNGGFLYSHVAKQIGVAPTQFSEMLNGKRSLTASVCVALESVFGISAIHWFHKQADYELEQARQAFIVQQAKKRFGVE